MLSEDNDKVKNGMKQKPMEISGTKPLGNMKDKGSEERHKI